MPSQHDSIATHLAKFVSSTSFRNSPQIFVMSRDLPMQQWMPCHVLEPTPSTLGNPPPVVDFRELALAQVDDPNLARLQATSSFCLDQVPLTLSDGLFIVCDVSTGTQHPYIPKAFRRAICIPYPTLASEQCNV